MPYQDDNPERRNLMLISTLFVTFFYGGGTVTTADISFPMVNVSFMKPAAVITIIWIVFFWFLYRFALVHGIRFVDDMKNDFADRITLEPSIYTYLDVQLSRQITSGPRGSIVRIEQQFGTNEVVGDDGFFVQAIGWHPFGNSTVTLIYARNIKLDGSGKVESYTPSDDICHVVELPTTLSLPTELRCAVTRRSFSEHAVPYLLAYLAMIGGVNQLGSSV
jgi:hypothetical protein